MGIALTLYNGLGSMAMLAILISLPLKHSRTIQILKFSSNYFFSVLYFSVYGSFDKMVTFILWSYYECDSFPLQCWLLGHHPYPANKNMFDRAIRHGNLALRNQQSWEIVPDSLQYVVYVCCLTGGISMPWLCQCNDPLKQNGLLNSTPSRFSRKKLLPSPFDLYLYK